MRTILWRRLDRPGHEVCRLASRQDNWHLEGTAVIAHERMPCRLDYLIVCDLAWRTLSCRVAGWIGEDPVDVEVAADASRRWTLDGRDQPQVAGAVDIDLNFSPSTNLLPIRRLSLAPGAAAPVRAAWLRFPSFTLELLEQTYHRLNDSTYRYESAGGAFVADLRVDADGLVTRYEGFCEDALEPITR